MTNNTRIVFYACLLLLAITVGACVKDSTVPESIHKQPQDFSLADARAHYEENIENICFPEIYLKSIIQTKGSDYFHSLKQTPLWDNVNFVENEWSYIYEIPILYNFPIRVSMGYLTKDGDMIDSNKDATLQSNLIIQKYKKSGRVYIFLSTIIGYIPLPDEYEQGHSPWLWTGDRQNFTGYQLFTNTDGSFRGAFQYRNSKRTSIALSIYDKDREYTYPQEAFTLNLGPVGTKSVGTRSDDQYCWECRMPMSSEDTYCPSCGAGPETLPPAIVIEDATCEQCDLLLSNCICGHGGESGGDDGDDGDRCPYCPSSTCSGECQEIGGGQSGDSSPNDIDTLINYDENSKLIIKPIIDSLKNECFGDILFEKIKVQIVHVPNLSLGESSYNRRDKMIKWKTESVFTKGQIIHELFHAYAAQACDNKFKAYDINNEIQARILQYVYCRVNQYELQETPEKIDQFIEYYKNPTKAKYDSLVNWIKPTYPDYKEYPNTANNINEVTNLLSKCEQYQLKE